MLKFNKYKNMQLNESIHPYQYIVVRVENEKELDYLYEFLNNLFSKITDLPIDEGTRRYNSVFPTYIYIPSGLYQNIKNYDRGNSINIYNISEETRIQGGYDTNVYFIKSEYMDGNILTIKDLTKVKNLLVSGKIEPNYGTTKLVYEAIMEKKYPYMEVVVRVKSKEETLKLIVFLEKLISNCDCRTQLIDMTLYPNYIFIPTRTYYGTSERILELSDSDGDDCDELIKKYIGKNGCDPELLTTSSSDLNILENILVNGERKINIDYNKSKELVYEANVENKYPYKEVVVRIDDETDVKKLFDYIKILFPHVPEITNQEILKIIEKYEFPNYIFLEVFYYRMILKKREQIRIGFLSEETPDEDDLNKAIFDNEKIDSDIITMKNITKLKPILTGEKEAPDYNTTKDLIYETKEENENYKYPWIVVKVDSNEDIEMLYNDMEIFFSNINKTISDKKYIDSFTYFPNYIFISSFSYYNSSEDVSDNFASLGSKRVSDNDYERYLTRPNNSDIMDGTIYNINQLTKVKSILKRGTSGPNYNTKELVYESNMNDILKIENSGINYIKSKQLFEQNKKIEYKYPWIVVKVDSNEDIKILYDYLTSVVAPNKTINNHSMVNFFEFLPNYIFISSNLYYSSHNDVSGSFTYISRYEIIEGSDVYNQHLTKDSSSMNGTIYNMRQLNQVKQLLINGRIGPEYNTPKKLVYESKEENKNYKYPWIVVKVNNVDEVNILYDYLDNLITSVYKIISCRKLLEIFKSYPNYIFINSYLLYQDSNDLTHDIAYLTDVAVTDEEKKYYLTKGKYMNGRIYNINQLYIVKQILIDGKDEPNYEPKKLIYESNEYKKVLYAFDMDDTLVYSETFEEQVKDLLLEKISPKSIFLAQLKKYNVDLETLKYENGRIYFNDPKHEFVIDEYETDWVRKKNRIYITQPEEYLLTDESLPISKNNKIVDLYNNVDNKCIITARKETFKHKIKEALKDLKIDIPNYGMFFFKEKSKFSNKSKYKCDILIKLFEEDGFDMIHYYDDNIKLLKRMIVYMEDYKNINIIFHKVSEHKTKTVKKDDKKI